jgi:hypothetical protein
MSWQSSFVRLGPRERRLLSAFFGVLAALVLLVVPILTQRAVLMKRGENQQFREVIEELMESQPALVKAETQRKAIVARYAHVAPPLGAFLDNQARQNGIEIPENQERPILPHGKRFDERSTRLQMRKVDLASFARFMEGVERSQFPIIFSRLDIRKRLSESDSYDVEIIASAYDRKELSKVEGSAQGAGSSAPRSVGSNKAGGNEP